MIISTLKTLVSIAAKATTDRHAGSGRRRPTRLAVERLEARDVPAVFNVTTGFDSGEGSLREAIAAANAHVNDDPSGDVIQIADNVDVILLETALPDVNDSVQIIGRSSITTVKRDPAAELSFRIFTIYPNGELFRLENLDITGGVVGDISTGTAGDGGGIWSMGQLTLVNCYVHGNTAAHDGGGIHQQMAPLTIIGGSIGGNEAGNNGGGICFVLDGAMNLTIDSAQLVGNFAHNDGGGIYYNVSQGAIRITNSDFQSNSALLSTPDSIIGGKGGGIYCVCTDIDVIGCHMTRNRSLSSGGAIYAVVLGEGTFDSQIQGNKSLLDPSTDGLLVRYGGNAPIYIGPGVRDPYRVIPFVGTP